jgi:hypothetical protein
VADAIENVYCQFEKISSLLAWTNFDVKRIEILCSLFAKLQHRASLCKPASRTEQGTHGPRRACELTGLPGGAEHSVGASSASFLGPLISQCPPAPWRVYTRDESDTDIIRPTDRPKVSDTEMVTPYSNPDI